MSFAAEQNDFFYCVPEIHYITAEGTNSRVYIYFSLHNKLRKIVSDTRDCLRDYSIPNGFEENSE